MKKFTFYNDSWYDSWIGCDCCPGQWMECYNSNDTAPNFGSAHSEEDCYAQAIMTELGDYNEEYWSMDLEELKEVAKSLNIIVEIDCGSQ